MLSFRPQRLDVIVAHRIDGQPLPVRERSPFFVIHPVGQGAELRAARHGRCAIRQLEAVEID